MPNQVQAAIPPSKDVDGDRRIFIALLGELPFCVDHFSRERLSGQFLTSKLLNYLPDRPTPDSPDRKLDSVQVSIELRNTGLTTERENARQAK